MPLKSNRLEGWEGSEETIPKSDSQWMRKYGVAFHWEDGGMEGTDSRCMDLDGVQSKSQRLQGKDVLYSNEHSHSSKNAHPKTKLSGEVCIDRDA